MPVIVTALLYATEWVDTFAATDVGKSAPPVSCRKIHAPPEVPPTSASAMSAVPSDVRSPVEVAASPPGDAVPGNVHGAPRPPVSCWR